MLSISPNLVGAERPIDGEHADSKNIATPPEGWSLEGAAPWSWLTEDLSRTGVIGDSRESSLELGNALYKALVEHWTALLANLMASDWPPLEGANLLDK